MRIFSTAFRCSPTQRPIQGRTLPGALLGLAASLLAFLTVAAEPGANTRQTLRVGVSPVFPPMVFKQGKELAGAEVDLARALADKLGRTVVFVEMDWKDQTEFLNAGKVDIIMSSMSVTPARNAVISFTRPYLKIGQMALVRREDRSKHPLGLMVPSGTKVGVIKATTGDFLVQRDFPRVVRKTYSNSDEAAKALLKGNVEMFISDSTLVWYLAGSRAVDGLTAVPFVLSEEVLAWGVRRGDDATLAAANEFLSAAMQDGTLSKVFRRWMAVGN